MQKQALGKGLGALIPDLSSLDDKERKALGISEIALDKIIPNEYQPRKTFDDGKLKELAASIREQGVIQPVIVHRTAGGSYQLIAGERRWRAARLAGLKTIPALVKEATKRELLEMALIENIQREDLNALEAAEAYKRLQDEFKLTQEDLAKRVGKERSTITNFLRLLKLPEPIQSAVRKGEISSGHARALIAIDDPARQMDIFRKTVGRGLSVRDVERLAREKKGKPAHRRGGGGHPTGAVSSSLSSIEERLRQFLGTRVQVRMLQDGKGEILIEYYSADDLERILEIFSEIEDGTR